MTSYILKTYQYLSDTHAIAANIDLSRIDNKKLLYWYHQGHFDLDFCNNLQEK